MKQQKRSYNRSQANRGRVLENLIDMTHNQYRNGGYADIRKVPTPVKIMKVNGSQVYGHLESGYWVDYVGAFQGRMVVFDAKETRLKNLPLKNISLHQYQLLQSWHIQGAASFLLVSFTELHEEIYILRFEQLRAAWETKEAGGPKSIPIQYFKDNCIPVKSRSGYALHYLDALTTFKE